MTTTYYENGYQNESQRTAGDQFLPDNPNTRINCLASGLTHPNSALDPVTYIAKGQPCVYGNLVGVCLDNETATRTYVPVALDGGFTLDVVAQDNGGTSAVAFGDIIYIDKTTAVLSKIADKATNRPFGIAMSTLSSGTDQVGVLVCANVNTGQRDLYVDAIPLTSFRIHDDITTELPATASSNNFGLVNGTFLTSAPYLLSETARNTTATDYARVQHKVPAGYVAGQTLTLRINAGMDTQVAGTSATLDVECVEPGAPTTDICATGAQSINSLVASNKDFTLTPTNVIAGDILDIRLTGLATDAVDSAAVYMKINSVTLLADVVA